VTGLVRQLHKWSENELVVVTSECTSLFDLRQSLSAVSTFRNSRNAPLLCGAIQRESQVLASGSELVGSDAFIDLWSVLLP